MKKSQQTPYKNWKEQPIKEFFEETISHRKYGIKLGIYEFADEGSIKSMLLRNFDETVEFLAHATMEETLCAIDVLYDLAEALPNEKTQILIGIFQAKLEEYPDVLKSPVADYVDYLGLLQLAQEVIDRKNSE